MSQVTAGAPGKRKLAVEGKVGSSKHQKRFLWQNSLHVRFLMSLFDWGLENISEKQLTESLDIEGMSADRVAELLKEYRKTISAPRDAAVAAVDHSIFIEANHAMPPSHVIGAQTNFTEYPLKSDYVERVSKQQQETGKNLGGVKGASEVESPLPVLLENHTNGMLCSHSRSGESFCDPAHSTSRDPLKLPADEISHTMWDKGTLSTGQVQLPRHLHLEMMERHTANLLRYGYNQDPTSAGLYDFDFQNIKADPLAAEHASRSSSSLTSLSTITSPAMMSEAGSDFSQVDDDLFNFLLEES